MLTRSKFSIFFLACLQFLNLEVPPSVSRRGQCAAVVVADPIPLVRGG